MTPVDAAVIRRKLRRIRSNLDTLAGVVVDVDEHGYSRNEILRRAVERLLQETIDAAVDVNNHLLRGSDRAPAEDYYGSFIDLGRAGILDEALVRELAPAAGLRNRIVHEYEELDHPRILAAAREAPDRLRAYIAAVEAYLTAHGL